VRAPEDLREGAGRHAVVVGYARTGQVAARWLARHGWVVTVVEDDEQRGAQLAGSVPFGLVVAPGPSRQAELGAGATLVVPSPGVAFRHPLLDAALKAGVPVVPEVELAWAEVQAQRSAGADVTLAGVTGTNGKTTVAELAGAMLERSGKHVVVAGNVGYPLLAAAEELSGQEEAVVVAELSSFQLCFVDRLCLEVSCWLNFAPDHLDWHPSLDHYASAKARIWAGQTTGCTAVVNVGDPVVAAAAASVPPGVEVVTFGPKSEGSGASWAFGPQGVEGPGGFALAPAELARCFPHDLANVAAACAVAVAAGADLSGCAAAAREHRPPPHRVELVGQAEGVSWYDDSKATTPASVLAAVRAFGSVVLIAGGRNKGLDLSALASAVPPVKAVVAIGEAAGELAELFAGRVPVRRASSMEQAVEAAHQLARPGDAVLLSPACASFDWYSSYAERGEHFSALVRARLALPATVGAAQ